jgi:hypothetical protein
MTENPEPDDDPRVPEPPDEFTYEEGVGWVYGYRAALDAVEALGGEG